jgi:hypothetical protein
VNVSAAVNVPLLTPSSVTLNVSTPATSGPVAVVIVSLPLDVSVMPSAQVGSVVATPVSLAVTVIVTLAPSFAVFAGVALSTDEVTANVSPAAQVEAAAKAGVALKRQTAPSSMNIEIIVRNSRRLDIDVVSVALISLFLHGTLVDTPRRQPCPPRTI